MRGIAILVGMITLLTAGIIGPDVIVWRAPELVRLPASVGLIAVVLGILATVQSWRGAKHTTLWLVLWILVQSAFMVLMPAHALRRPAPEEQFGRSLLFALLFASILLPLVWRAWRRSHHTDGGRAESEQRSRPAG